MSKPQGFIAERRCRTGQGGASLILVMTATALIGVILAASLVFAQVSTKSTTAYRTALVTRTEADGAIKSAINYVRDQARLGRDPLLSASDPACRYQVPTATGEKLMVTCASEAGSGSGKPRDGGLNPPAALILTGTRHNEPGPYNVPDCKGWFDPVRYFFDSDTDPNYSEDSAEQSALFQRRKGLGTVNFSCDQQAARQAGSFKVKGDVVAAGKVSVPYGTLDVSGAVKAGAGCTGTVLSTPTGCAVPTAAEVADPGASSSAGLGVSTAYQAVGFNADGSASGSLPERTTAYQWNGSGQALTALANCTSVGNSTTIVFLPGWYRSASMLNAYTKNASCGDRTFWFAPDPGPDGLLLTEDDKTGAFYFDFRNGSASGQTCGSMAENLARWCVGGSASSNPRVVVGTPNGWSPLGSTTANNTPGGADTRNRIKVTIATAGTVDSALSQSWSNANGAKNINDTSYARYQPTLFFSDDRAIRVRDFTPQVTGSPIDDSPTYPRGRVYVNIAYGTTNDAALTTTLEIKTVTASSGTSDCGTFVLPKQTLPGSGVPATYRFTDAYAKRLADACGSPDKLNGLELTLKNTGNVLNSGSPNVYLGGASIDFDSLQGASFPNPTNVGTGSEYVAARNDCDSTKPGAQLIFGGQSHVVVADGSIEVCAGAYPTAPEDHQVIGVYGVPQVAPLRPTAVAGNGGDDSPSYGNLSVANMRIGEPTSRQEASITYGGCAAYCGQEWEEGRVQLTMPEYRAPAGYKIKRVDARVAYNSKNGWLGLGGASQLRVGGCNIDAPLTNRTIQYSNAGSLALYDSAGGANCLSGSLQSGNTVLASTTAIWAARAHCAQTEIFGWVCKAGGGDWNDNLEGVEWDVTLEPIDNSQPRLIPQSGCITAHANYNAGEGRPDCAIVKATTDKQADSYSFPWDQKEGEWRGRLSVRGTVYAPSAAIEVDDTDYAYPLASRGLIARYLMVSGWANRVNYDLAAVGNQSDPTPSAREMTFVTCSQSAARQASGNQGCDTAAGDRIWTQARVRFELDPAATVAAANKSRVPKVMWWSENL